MDNQNITQQQTVIGLLNELLEEVRMAQATVEDLNHSVFGPRPSSGDISGKDPRSDMRSLIERSLSRMRELNADLTRVNNGLGIPSSKLGYGDVDQTGTNAAMASQRRY
jgi:hypothetical protein